MVVLVWPFISLLLLLAALPAQGLSKRFDLFKPLRKMACSQGRQGPPHLKELWSHGIFDTGLRLMIIDTQSPKSPSTLANMENQSQQIARRRHHLGYIYGQCQQGIFFIATTPASAPLIKKGENLIADIKTLGQDCRQFRVDYAQADQSKPRKIYSFQGIHPKKSMQVSTKYLKKGTLSVTCNPTSPAWLGNSLWYIAPVGEGPLNTAPLIQGLQGGDLLSDLATWTNRIRKSMDLQPLLTDSRQLNQFSGLLIEQNPSVVHNRIDMKKLADKLKAIQGRFIGENRVKALDFPQAAWLLWNSPRHRSLLLNKRATHLSLAGKASNTDELAVMVFAKL